MPRKKRKDDEKRKNLSFAEINKREVETLQSIKHYRVRKLSRSNRTLRNEKRNLENQRNSLDYLFHRFDSLFLELTKLTNFLLLETDFVKTSKETYINEYHLHRSESDIKIRAIRHFLIEHRTERTFFVLESRKVEHAFNFFFQTIQTESLIILTFQIICVANRFKMNHVMRARLKIFRSGLDEIKLLSKFDKLLSLTLSRMSVFLNTS